MTKLLISTALVGLLAASGAAFAQDDHRGRGHETQSSPAPAAPPQAIRGPDAHRDDRRGPPPAPAAAPVRGAPPAGRPDDRRFNGPRPDAQGFRQDNRANPPQRFAPGVNRASGARPDFRNWQRNFSAQRRFHAPNYRRPAGWYAHRWVFGEFLPSFFWAPDYWIDDYYDYALAPPPPGTVWVRDGEDALLIDRFSGEIIQVEYSVFY